MTRRTPWIGARSSLASIEFPPIVTGSNATLTALIRQLDDTQWLPREELEKAQFAQLRHLARHAAQFSPHFRRRMSGAKLTPDQLTSMEALRRLPVLRRRELQSGDVLCSEVPQAHQPVGESKTSGSTGEPIAAKRTAVNQLMWLAMAMREHLWHRTDFATRLCAIRANIFQIARDAEWGAPANLLFRTGQALRLPITLSAAQLTAHLVEFKPANLIVYPNTLAALAQHMEDEGIRPEGLTTLRTIGETVSPELRQTAERVFGARLIDSYSSQELGHIALQCPESGLYHAMAESLIVEVVGEDGAPCGVGQVGRVVATDLHNFATPLVRYDIGDYAEVAAPCPCGRGLPALKRIVGRERNLIVMPDGTRHWPLVGFHRFRDVAPVAQYQLIQETRQDIEVRLVVDTPLTVQQEADLRQVIQEALGHPFNLRFAYFDGALPRGAGGKFDEFVCKVDAGKK
ncbi:MAG: AMP-binding protein [Alphaproteobacteria bacterium]|nr:AMP-binding protein [Alphaproteobacteria bacterium]